MGQAYVRYVPRQSLSVKRNDDTFSSEHVGQYGSEGRTDDSEFNLKIVLFISLITLLTLMLRELSERY